MPERPRISFVIPAHDEAQILEGSLRALRQAADALGEPYEIVVVDDASVDATPDIAAASGATVVRVNVRQIAGARNAGARVAGGDVLFFVDADTTPGADTLRAALRALSDGAVGGGARVRFDRPIPRYARPGVAATFAAFRLLNLTVGCFMFCTRAAFDAIDGFDERLFAAEEVAFSRALKRVGRLVLVEPAVVTSARKFRTHGPMELARMTWATLHVGRRLRSREHLTLWYGRRRRDPDAP